MAKERKKSIFGKHLAFGLAIAFLVTAFPVLYFFYLMAPPWQGIKQTERDFKKNKDAITLVKDYLADSDYDHISITSSMERGIMCVFILGQSYVTISDDEVVEAITQLHRKGYSSISKKSNAINFVRWTGKDVGKGVVYSIDGHIPDEDSLIFLTKIEPLSEDGWYYYEEDYNKWRIGKSGWGTKWSPTTMNKS